MSNLQYFLDQNNKNIDVLNALIAWLKDKDNFNTHHQLLSMKIEEWQANIALMTINIHINSVKVNNITIRSQNLIKNLSGCEKCILFGITLGAMVDRVLQKYEKTNMAKAVVFQACAAAYLEEECNKMQLSWAEELKQEEK